LIRIRRLPPTRWKEYRKLRLEALRSEPSAFASAYEEEKVLPEDEWRRRIRNTLFAMRDGTPVGMIVYSFNTRLKTRHIAGIYGVFVGTAHRGEGIGEMLVQSALSRIRRNKSILKVQLSVNPGLRPALELYKKAGFVVSGRARRELKIGRRFFDLLYMEKALS
jgi:ribosomal protein S18 acetylase RimI-like enzyme